MMKKITEVQVKKEQQLEISNFNSIQVGKVCGVLPVKRTIKNNKFFVSSADLRLAIFLETVSSFV